MSEIENGETGAGPRSIVSDHSGPRPTPNCSLRCEENYRYEQPVVMAKAWDGTPYALGTCAYPYCDPTSPRMVSYLGAKS